MNRIFFELLAILPYFTIKDINIWKLPLHPFGLLVALGVVIGHRIATKRAKVLGLDEQRFESLVFATVATGFVLSHMLDQIFYHPAQLRDAPWEILMIHHGLSSFGGFFGAAIGFAVYSRRHRIDVPVQSGAAAGKARASAGVELPPVSSDGRSDLWRAADAIGYGLPVGWLFGRMGCSVVHDHPGRESHGFFAVNYPLSSQSPMKTFGPIQVNPVTALGYPRLDLGLLELAFTPILILAAFYVGHRTKKPGTVIATLALVYPFIRFPLDFFRVGDREGGDVRYFGLTPGQYACVLLFLFGIYILRRTARFRTEPAV